MAGALLEEKVRLRLCKGVFFNPHMRLCRSVFSLAVGALGRKIEVADAMCASGVRGLRYKSENENVGRLALVDCSKSAIRCAKRNAIENKIECKAYCKDARDFLRASPFDFVELDPFGTPRPYLHDALFSIKAKGGGWLSATATDMAVLCGAQREACLKNYASFPINNEFCHENACRILIGAVLREAAPMDLSAAPIFSFSHRHYVKILFRVEEGAKKAVEMMKKMGYISYCSSCLWRDFGRWQIIKNCPQCYKPVQIGGPLYLGGLWGEGLVRKMASLNSTRDYADKKEIGKIAETIMQESRINGVGYYDLHVWAKKLKRRILPIGEAIEKIRGAGFSASRTHFCPTAIRTDASHEEMMLFLH